MDLVPAKDRRTYLEEGRESPLRSGCLGTRCHRRPSEACLLSTGRTIPNATKAAGSFLRAVCVIQKTTHLCFVDVVVVPFVGTPDQHDDEILSVIESFITDRRLEKVTVLLEPLWDIDWW